MVSSVAAFAVVPATSGDPADTAFQYVGQVGGASGVAVGTNKVLTAKHVGGNVGDIFSLAGFGNFTITSRVENPDADFVVLTVAENLPGFYHVTYTDPVPSNQAITMVGYGSSGTLRTDGSGYDINLGTQRRTGTNTVFGRLTVELPPSFNSPVTGQTSLASTSLVARLTQNGDSALAGGDSGGGWFVNEAGEYRLVGVNSFIGLFGNWTDNYGFSNDDQNFFGSGAVDLTSYRTFLEDNGVTPVPEPASMAVLSIGALAMLRRRRAKK